MIPFESFSANPCAFVSLSGLSLDDLGALYWDFSPAYAQDRQASPTRKGNRASGRRAVARSSRRAGALAC